MKARFLLLIAGSLMLQPTCKKTPEIQWEKTFGGSYQDVPSCIQQTKDGGFIVAGSAGSYGGDVTHNHGLADYWIIKTDKAGQLQWQKSFGGTYFDLCGFVRQTQDGGYIIAGQTYSNDEEVKGNHGISDFWILKTDVEGNIQWRKVIGGKKPDALSSIQQTNDGGYIAAGGTKSSDGDIKVNRGGQDACIIRMDNAGNLLWERTYGGSNDDIANTVISTQDGGYVVAGSTASNDSDVAYNHGDADYWVIKLDSVGNAQWQHTYGGSGEDVANSIVQSSDGSYVVAGYVNSNDSDVTSNHGFSDYWIIKISDKGKLIWQKTFGGVLFDEANTVQQSSDGGFIVSGFTNSIEGDVTNNHGLDDCWIIKLDEQGKLQWQKTFGGSENDLASFIIQTTDGGYAVVAQTKSKDGDITNNKGSYDYCIVKLKPERLSSGCR